MAAPAPLPLDIDGPVRAEVLVVRLAADGLRLTGPCGPAPWLIETDRVHHPLALVERMARRVLGDVLVVHSTSWRWERDAVVLTFVVAACDPHVARLTSAPVHRLPLARGAATTAPDTIATGQVLEHALRHLAWLAHDDAAVADVLPPSWHAALRYYTPEPFQQLSLAPTVAHP